MSLKKTENIFVLGLFLAFTGLLSAFILAYFAGVTAKPIADAEMRSTNESLKAVLPEFSHTQICTIDDVKYYGAFDKNNNLVGVAGEGSVKGYAGDVVALVGLELDGTIIAVIITKQTETPGLGTNVCERKEQKTLSSIFSKKAESNGLPPNRILNYYSGKKCENGQNFTVSKDGGSAPYITGATVTSRAVAKVISIVDNTFIDKKSEIVAELNRLNKEAK